MGVSEETDLEKHLKNALDLTLPIPADRTVKGGFNQNRKEEILYYDCPYYRGFLANQTSL